MFNRNHKINAVVASLEEAGLFVAIFLVPAILWAA